MQKVELSEAELKVLLDSYRREIEEQNKIANEAMRRVAQAETRIRQLSGNSLFPTPPPPPPLPSFENLTLADKAKRVLTDLRLFASTRDIAVLILKTEGKTATTANEISSLVSNVSATLKQKVDKGEVFQRMEIGEEIFYGLRVWYHPNGTAADEFISPALKRKMEDSLIQAINKKVRER